MATPYTPASIQLYAWDLESLNDALRQIQGRIEGIASTRGTVYLDGTVIVVADRTLYYRDSTGAILHGFGNIPL